MGRIITVVVVVLAGLTVVGIVLPAIYRAREEEEMRRCQNNLRQIIGLGLLHSALPGDPVPAELQKSFPAATIVRESLSVGQRLSWYPTVIGAVDQGPLKPGEHPPQNQPHSELMRGLDLNKAWDAGSNLNVARNRLTFALCPAVRSEGPNGTGATNYPANGGIGVDTPALPIEKTGINAGSFRYDTPTPLEAIRSADGLGHTLAVGETALNVGPWLQGGPATVRTLELDDKPYLGAGRRYGGCHRGRGNFAFCDSSVRVITDRIDPAIFAAGLTIQGNEAEFNKP